MRPTIPSWGPPTCVLLWMLVIACPAERQSSEDNTSDPWAVPKDGAASKETSWSPPGATSPPSGPGAGATFGGSPMENAEGRPPDSAEGSDGPASQGMVRAGSGYLMTGGPGPQEGEGGGGPGGPGGPGAPGTRSVEGQPSGPLDGGGPPGQARPGEGVFPHVEESTPADPSLLSGARRLVISADLGAEAVTIGTVRLMGLLLVQLDESGMPLPHATPSYHWAAPAGDRTWPTTIRTEVPTDGRTWLMAWIDEDDDGRADPGERISSPHAPQPMLVPGEDRRAATEREIHLRIDRVATGPVGIKGYGAWGRWVATIDGDADTVQVTEARLLLVGYKPEHVTTEGYPTREGHPMLQWTSPDKKRVWPQEVEFEVPEGQTPILFAILDRNGDGHLSPGDRLGSTGTPVTDSPPIGGYRIVIDQELPGGEAILPTPTIAGCGGK